MASEASSGAPPLHVLMVSYPGHGHVNPLLRLGNCLASMGLSITFSTTERFGKDLRNTKNITHDLPIQVGNGTIRFEFFDDEFDFSNVKFENFDSYLQHLELIGKEKLTHMIKKHEEQANPFCCIINNPFVPWVSDVAQSLGISNAVLWVQSCACFAAYYHYQHSLVPFPSGNEPELDVQLPFMPLLKHDELPGLLHPSTHYASFKKVLLDQFKNLEKPICILMDTFHELEDELIEYMSKLLPIKPIGPLFKILKINKSIDQHHNCIEWLDSKPKSSVVYVSFGTVVQLKQEQVDEIANGLLNSKVSFLWVMKPPIAGLDYERTVLPDGFLEMVGDNGKVVEWCPQEQVLAHPSISCFLTHCGWNSTMESLANGVPSLTFPHFSDQLTNAKYLVDVFKVGIRLCRGAAENKIINRDEVEKCLVEATKGAKAAEMKENALKWRKKAEEAVAEGGSSITNLQSFVDKLTSCKVTLKELK